MAIGSSPSQQTASLYSASPNGARYLVVQSGFDSLKRTTLNRGFTYTERQHMTWQRVHPKYNRYDNPYASPPPTYDSSVCDYCNGDTGREGQSSLKAVCPDCSETLWFTYIAYQEEESNDQ
jgi:hypothetical protein